MFLSPNMLHRYKYTYIQLVLTFALLYNNQTSNQINLVLHTVCVHFAQVWSFSKVIGLPQTHLILLSIDLLLVFNFVGYRPTCRTD